MTERTVKKTKEPRGVQSIDIGGHILEAFVAASGPIKLKDLSDLTGLAPGKLHPYLVSFCNMKLLERSDHGWYTLGPFALHLGLARLRGLNPYKETLKRVPELAEELGLMVSLAVWGPFGPTIIHIEERLDPIHFNIRVGGVYYLSMTASGHVFTAFLPKAVSAELVEKEFSDTEGDRRRYFQVDRGWFEATIEKTRARGYGMTRDMPTPGITAFAVPIFDHSGTIRLAVAAIGPNELTDDEGHERIVDCLTRFSQTLSQDLGLPNA
ncbi:IclR family transcriptional regulator [Marinovum sp.]|uniref:IclR family transcriptional regulator n=1 Tax=Marinovum sp. TaxID=2024839 RepID=UPI002B27B593|nr:IclR family transcriptional regulator [Marinovum sp.]